VSNNWLVAPWEMTPFLDKNGTKSLDKYHTHFLLFDDGRLDQYLGDGHRSDFIQNTCDGKDCYAVTIIVEGGRNSLEVIWNDLKKNRPVVIVHGSGRLADVLGNLLENTTNSTIIRYMLFSLKLLILFIFTFIFRRDKIEQQLDLYITSWPQIKDEKQKIITEIEYVLDQKFRPYLSVFRLGEDASLTNTIFRAVLRSKNIERLCLIL
jgi:hypothetical protein